MKILVGRFILRINKIIKVEENPNPHLHLHARPRYRKNFNFGGQVYADEKFGHHYHPKKDVKISETIMKELFDKIRTEF